jgi:hypothetical protein
MAFETGFRLIGHSHTEGPVQQSTGKRLLPTLSGRTQIGTATTPLSSLIHGYTAVGRAHNAHELSLRTLCATGDAGSLWNMLAFP